MMNILSEYHGDSDRWSKVFKGKNCYIVHLSNGTNLTAVTEQAAENLAEDWVMQVVDSGPIAAKPPR